MLFTLKRTLLAALGAASLCHVASVALADDCKMTHVGGDTKIILFDHDIRFTDSYGIDFGGHNFGVGVASCDGRNDAAIEKQRPNGEGDIAIRLSGRYETCTVWRSRNWQSKPYTCHISHGGLGRESYGRGRMMPLIQIRRAIYRTVEPRDGRFSNATGAIANLCNNHGQCTVVVENAVLGGDPAPTVVKHLQIEYVCGRNGVRRVDFLEHDQKVLRCD